MNRESIGAALGHLRILDLSDETGAYCGKLFADMGADVILIEKPGGSAMRTIPPFIGETPNPEGSLFFAYHNTNKRSITLNMECRSGEDLFFRLVERADIVISSFSPSFIESHGLGYQQLKKKNSSVILTSITPFGITGPHKDYKGPDIVSLARGGLMNQTGSPEEPPVQGPGWQSYYVASTYAAVGTMIALYHRFSTGEGQQVDVSRQECVASLLEGTNPLYVYEGKVTERIGSQHPLAYPSRIFKCKDGFWVTNLNNAPLWRNLVDWVTSDGIGKDELRRDEFDDLATRRRPENDRIITPLLNKWGMLHTKHDIFMKGQERRLPVGPAMGIDEVFEDPHLREREYFVESDHQFMGSLKYPGAPYKLTETPWRIKNTAPLMGEHNKEVYGEIGLSDDVIDQYGKEGVI